MIEILKNKTYHLSKKWGEGMGVDLPYFLKNGFWIFLRQGMFLLSGLVLSVVFARLVSSEVVGYYQLVFSVFTLLSFFSIPGLNYALIQSVSRGFDGEYKISTKTRLSWSLFGSLFLLLFAFFYKENGPISVSFVIAALLFPLFYSYNSWEGFLQGKGRFEVVSVYYTALLFINLLISVGFIFYFRESLVLIITAYLGSYALLNIFFYKKSFRYIENEKKDKDLIGYGKKLTKANLFIIISDSFDKIILGIINPLLLAAYYFVSLLVFRIKDVAIPVFNIIIPKLSVSSGSFVGLLKEKKKVFFALFLGLLLISFVFYFSIEWINGLFFGESYSEYYFYSKYYVFFVFFYLPVTFLSKYCQAKKRDRVIFLADSSYSVIKMLLSVVLIYKYNIVGAIIAYNTSAFIWFIFYFVGILRAERDVTSSLELTMPNGQRRGK